jgi:hypothetical protein
MTAPEWGDKGCAYRPDKCTHEPDDGCEWCCMTCNLDRHWCPGCGTVSDHKESPCDNECAEKAKARRVTVKVARMCGGRYRGGSWLRRVPGGVVSDKLGVGFWWRFK